MSEPATHHAVTLHRLRYADSDVDRPRDHVVEPPAQWPMVDQEHDQFPTFTSADEAISWFHVIGRRTAGCLMWAGGAEKRRAGMLTLMLTTVPAPALSPADPVLDAQVVSYDAPPADAEGSPAGDQVDSRRGT